MDFMIVSGVHLDHAWVGLGAEFGTALREWSTAALALAVEEANTRNAAVLLIAGDLYDRSYALPATIDYASQVLGTFTGDVLIVPGRSDWYDDTCLYNTHTWAPNIQICKSSDYLPSAFAPTVWVSAWTSPGGYAPRLPPTGPEPRVLIRSDVSDESVLTVPDLVHDPREPGGFALLVDTARHDEPERVHLPGQPGSLVDIDVTDVEITDELNTAFAAALEPGAPLLLRVSGALAPGVLLPGYGGPELPPGVVLDLAALGYAMPSVEPTDHTARAEFIRAIANADVSELQQHQTIALGLAALGASAQGA